PLVGSERFRLRGRIFFEGDATGEPCGSFVLTRSRLGIRNGGAGYDFFPSGEVHHELSGNGLQQLALVTEGNAMLAGGGSTGLDERISHAGSLLLHGFKRFPDHRWPHSHGTQVADLLDRQQIGERIGGGGSDQTRTLPVRQLARSQVKNSE